MDLCEILEVTVIMMVVFVTIYLMLNMPSCSGIPGPIAWANNAIQERRQESLPITPAKCGNPVGRQSNLTHTLGDCASRLGEG